MRISNTNLYFNQKSNSFLLKKIGFTSSQYFLQERQLSPVNQKIINKRFEEQKQDIKNSSKENLSNKTNSKINTKKIAFMGCGILSAAILAGVIIYTLKGKPGKIENTIANAIPTNPDNAAKVGAAIPTVPSTKTQDNWVKHANSNTIPVDDIVTGDFDTDGLKIINNASSKDPETEFKNWLELRKKANEEIIAQGYKYGSNSEFTEFEIKPYIFDDNTYIYISSKHNSAFCPGVMRDYHETLFVPGSMDTYKCSGQAKNYRRRLRDWFKKFANDICNIQDKGTTGELIAGKDGSGKAFVYFTTENPIEPNFEDKRKSLAGYLLRSKSSEFTQIQKDIIRIFSDKNNAKYNEGKLGQCPLVLYKNLADKEQVQRSKTVFLSIIHSWAENSKNIDVDKILSQENGFIKLFLQ